MLSFDNKYKELVHNSIVNIEEHEVMDYYIMIPKYDTVDSVGVLNRHNPIKVTDKNSIMFYDNKEKTFINIPISEAMKDPFRYFLIIGAPPRDLNESVYIMKNNGDSSSILLTHTLGLLISFYLKHLVGEPIIANTFVHDYLEGHKSEWEKWFDLQFSYHRKTYNSSLMEIKFKVDNRDIYHFVR